MEKAVAAKATKVRMKNFSEEIHDLNDWVLFIFYLGLLVICHVGIVFKHLLKVALIFLHMEKSYHKMLKTL